MRIDGNASITILRDIHERLLNFPKEWLIRLEMLELCTENHYEPLASMLRSELGTLCNVSSEFDDLIKSGLEMLGNQQAMVEF